MHINMCNVHNVYACVCVCVCVYYSMCTSTLCFMCMGVCVCIHTYMYVYVYVYVYVHVYVHYNHYVPLKITCKTRVVGFPQSRACMVTPHIPATLHHCTGTGVSLISLAYYGVA